MSSPPTKYQRFFDFTTFAANNPDKPLPGNAVDVEFNRLKQTTDQTIDRLNLIQRDDGKLADGAITENSIADGAVTTAKLADGAVTTPKIADGAVTGPKIAPGTINGGALAPGSIGTVQLADGGVTQAKMANNSVGTLQLIDGSVTAAKLAANSVGSANIIDGSIDPADLSAATISLISSAGNPRGAWAPATAYAAKDSVTNGSGVYVCVVPHTSGATFAPDLASGKWFQTGSIFNQNLNTTDNVAFNTLATVGNVTVGNSTGAPSLILKAAAGSNPALELHQNNFKRWAMFADATTALNVGRFDAAGAFLGNALTITNANGVVGVGVIPSGWNNGRPALQIGQNSIFTPPGGTPSLYLGSNLFHDGAGYKLIAAAPASMIVLDATVPEIDFYTAPTGAAGAAAVLGLRLSMQASGLNPGSDNAYDLGIGNRFRTVRAVDGIFASTLSGAAGLDCGASRRWHKYISGMNGTSGGNWDVVHVPTPGTGITRISIRAMCFLQNIQNNYTTHIREDMWIFSDSGGTPADRQMSGIISAQHFSINGSVLDLTFSWDFLRSGGQGYIRVWPVVTGANSAGSLVGGYFEVTASGDNATGVF